MRLRFEPSGTHVHKEYLKVRVDLIPEPTDKTYAIHHIEVLDETSAAYLKGYNGKLDEMGNPVDQEAYDAWIASLPKIWVTNPCLCYFLIINEGDTLTQILERISHIFDKDTVALLDEKLIQPVTDLSEVTKLKEPIVASKVSLVDIEVINTKFASLEVNL